MSTHPAPGATRPHVHDLRPFAHSHAFADASLRRRERALAQVTLLTLAAMAVELAAGWWSGSLALLADGWHMGTHALALGGAVLAYRLSARAAGRDGHAFGGWKIEVLAAYTSGLALLGAALWIAWDAVQRLQQPQPIAFAEAMAVAAFGLAVNLLSAWLLARGVGHGPAHGHGHAHSHGHSHGRGHANGPGPGHDPAPGQARGDGAAARAAPVAHAEHAPHAGHARHGHDHNFSAAYLHVVADAFTSVLAIVALAGGLWFGLAWLDAAVALLGAAVIGHWSIGVLRASARALTDATADPALRERIRERVESDGDAQVSDLHVWQVGAQAWSAALAVVADRPLPALAYRERLDGLAQLRHVTVEVHRCPSAPGAV